MNTRPFVLGLVCAAVLATTASAQTFTIGASTSEFKLRRGVKFHAGSDFTAADVKFLIECIPVVSGPNPTTIYVRRAWCWRATMLSGAPGNPGSAMYARKFPTMRRALRSWQRASWT